MADSLLCGARKKCAILRNEPTVLADEVLRINLLSKYLCCLQSRFAGGFVLENEPTGGVFSGGIRGKVGSFMESDAAWGSRDGNVLPTFKPRKEFGVERAGGRN